MGVVRETAALAKAAYLPGARPLLLGASWAWWAWSILFPVYRWER